VCVRVCVREREGLKGAATHYMTIDTCVAGCQPGFKLPTGSAKSAGSGTSIPDRFGRKPVQTGRSQILTGLPVGLTGNRPNSIFFV